MNIEKSKDIKWSWQMDEADCDGTPLFLIADRRSQPIV